MALRDLIDRSVRITAAGRAFTVRPVSVLGMLEAQLILSSGPMDDSSITLDAMKAAVDAQDEAAAARALAEYYLAVLDAIGKDRLASLLALVSEPADVGVIALVLNDATALPTWFVAIGELHDIPRLLKRFSKTASKGLPTAGDDTDVDGIGLETVLVNVAKALPQYTIETILLWPYERLLTVMEQLRIIGELQQPVNVSDKGQRASPQDLARMGLHVQMPVRRKAAH